MRQHFIAGTVAAVISTAVTAGLMQSRPQQVTHVMHSIAVSKHAWPDLSDEEKTAIAAVLSGIPKSMRFDIVCNDASCSDLAEDIDDAMEMAGLESELDRSVLPLGYGVDLVVNDDDRATAEMAAQALKAATGGRLDLPVVMAPPGTTLPSTVLIRIGKYRPPAR